MAFFLAVVWLVLSAYVVLCVVVRLPPFRSRRKALFIGVPASFVVMVFLALNFPLSDRAGQATASSIVTAANGKPPASGRDGSRSGDLGSVGDAVASAPDGQGSPGLEGQIRRAERTTAVLVAGVDADVPEAKSSSKVDDAAPAEDVTAEDEAPLSITVADKRVTLVGLTHHNDGIDRRLTYRDPKVLRLTRDDVASGKWTIAEDSIDVFCFADGNNAVLAAISGRIHATNGKARQFTAFKDGDGVLVDDGELLQVHEPFDAPIALIDAARTAGLDLCGQKSIDQISEAANAAVEEPAEPEDPEQRKTVALSHIALAILGAELCRYQVEHGVIAMHAALAGLNPSKLADVIREPLLAAGVVLSSGPPAEICRDVVWAQYGSDGLGFVSR